jgi:CheY-like chemotaxis protein
MSKPILLVTDDHATVQQLRTALGKTTPQWIVESASRRETIEGLPLPSVIILDLLLANESPYDVLRWLRSESRYQKVPVFALGSEVHDQGIEEAYALGADSCLLRPPAAGVEPLAHGIAAFASLLPNGPALRAF